MFCQAGASGRIRSFPVFRPFRCSPVISNLRSRSGLSRCQEQQLFPRQVHIHQRAPGWHSSAVLDSAVSQIHTEDRRQGLERSPRFDLGSGRKGLVCRCRHPRRTCASACRSSRTLAESCCSQVMPCLELQLGLKLNHPRGSIASREAGPQDTRRWLLQITDLPER